MSAPAVPSGLWRGVLGADSDFGAVAEFEAVGEAGGGVDVDYSCIDFVQEFLGVGVVVGDDCFGVFCVVVVECVQSLRRWKRRF